MELAALMAALRGAFAARLKPTSAAKARQRAKRKKRRGKKS